MDIDMEEKATAYYLVDYDSVGQNGLNGIERLSEKDKVTIFYTAKKSTIELSFFEKIHSSKAEIIFKEIDNETSLKCLFSSYLGYNIMGTNPNTVYYIVSNDKEFKTLKKFWAEKEVDIEISSDIVIKIPVKSEQKSKKETKKVKEIKHSVENPLLSEVIDNFKLSESEEYDVYRIINDGRKQFPNHKNIQYDYIRKSLNLTFKDSGKIYNAIKPYI